MPTINRDGVNIYYEDHGTGPAILLSHGYSSTTRMWTGQVEALQDRYRIITWDMRGHGQSDSPDEPNAYSEAATVDDMAAIEMSCADGASGPTVESSASQGGRSVGWRYGLR